MAEWFYMVPKDEKVEKTFPGHKGRPGKVGGSLPRRAGGAAKREWMRYRGRKKEGRSKKWWAKWGNKKGAMSNPQAALEAAKVNDPFALAIFSRRVLLAAMAKTERPNLRERLKKAMLRR